MVEVVEPHQLQEVLVEINLVFQQSLQQEVVAVVIDVFLQDQVLVVVQAVVEVHHNLLQLHHLLMLAVQGIHLLYLLLKEIMVE